MNRLNDRIMLILGINRPFPYPHFVFYVIAIIAALQLVSNYLMLRVSLGLGVMVNEALIILGLPLLIAYLLKFDKKEMFPFVRPKSLVWPAAIIITLGVVIVIDYLTAASEAVWPLPADYRAIMDWMMAVSSRGEFAYKLFLLCLIPAICEEIFFRGFCQTTLARFGGTLFAILITGALFALLHGNLWYIHLYFLLGCFLSWIFSITRTLWIPILCHFLNNAWTLTNHTLETTLPWEGTSISLNAVIIIGAMVLTIVGGMILLKSRTK